MAEDKPADASETNDPAPRRRGKSQQASNSDSQQAAPEEPSQADLDKEHTKHRDAGEELPLVGLKLFATQHHLPADQLAGFSAYANVHHAGRRTIPEWNDLLASFKTQAVK